jgi:Domain of unknown function (DUF4340)
MKTRNLLAAAVVLAALSGLVWWAKKHPESGKTATDENGPAPRLAQLADSQVQSIDLKKKNGATLTLQRENGKWRITAPEQYPADQDSISSLISSLNPLNADSVVEDKPTNVGQYGLDAPALAVSVHEKNGKTDQFFFGNDVPVGSLTYARVGSDPKVYAVSSSTKSSLDKSVNDLRDKRLLTFDTNKLTRIELISAKNDLEFGKNNQGDWQIMKPQPYRADNFQVEELVRKLGDAKMDLSGTADDQKKAEAAAAAAQLVATAKVSDASGTQTLEVRKNKDDYYAKSGLVKEAYKISSDVGKELEKSLEDFRNKKVFDFGFSDPTKIEIQQNGGGKTYVRSGTDWKLDGRTMDAGTIQGLIDKLRDLAATKFVPAGFASPALTVAVTSNDGKRFEKIEFAKVADGYIARRENEPALYHLDAKPVDDILEASKGIKPAATSSKK